MEVLGLLELLDEWGVGIAGFSGVLEESESKVSGPRSKVEGGSSATSMSVVAGSVS